MKVLCQLAALAVALAASGCFETKQSYEINPDGSGRVKLESVYRPMNLNLNEKTTDPARIARQQARELVEQSDGVEAWEDVQYSTLDDDRVKLSGTAYFRNLNALKLHNIVQQRLRFETLPEGGIKISAVRAEDKVSTKKTPADPATLNLEKERAKFKQSRPMLESFLGSMRDEITLTLPGTADAASTMKAGGGGQLQVLFDGQALMAKIDALFADDQALQDFLAKGGTLDAKQGDDEAFDRLMFGAQGPGYAICKAPLKPVFDYAESVQRARQGQAALMESLGAPVYLQPSATNKLAFTNIQVAGVRLAHIMDQQNQVAPLGAFHDKYPYAISLLGTLPGAITMASDGKLLTAVSTRGEDLLPAESYTRNIQTRLSKDQRLLLLEVNLRRPANPADGIREISGEVDLLVQGGTEPVDLGFPALADGAVGTKFGAQLNVKASSYKKGETELELRFEQSRKFVEKVELRDADGALIKPSSTSSSSIGDHLTYTLLVPTLPAGARIVVTVRKDVVRQTVPFSIQDLNLLGEPLSP